MAHVYTFLRYSRPYVYLITLFCVAISLMLTGFVSERNLREIRQPLSEDFPLLDDIRPAFRPKQSTPQHILQKLNDKVVSPRANAFRQSYLSRLEQKAFTAMYKPTASLNANMDMVNFSEKSGNTPAITTSNLSQTLTPQYQCTPSPQLKKFLNKLVKARKVNNSFAYKRAHTYKYWVDMYARKYNLPAHLIYAIMYAESSFKPWLISNRNAHGLMQVVPSSAGREVHEWLGLQGKPSSAHLLDPAINIKYGTSYLHLLWTRHLGEIKNTRVRRYCTIAAYNMGITALLRTFGPTKAKAIQAINALSPDQAYAYLQAKMPARETRDYLKKVVTQMRYFSQPVATR